MFVSDSQACNLPNSETPMDPRAVAAQDRFISVVGQRFVNGDAVLSGLMSSLGGNALDALQGDAGVPTMGRGGFPWFPGPSVPNPFPVSDSGSPRAGGGGQPGGDITAACTPPVVLPWVTVVPFPPVRLASPTVPLPAKPVPKPIAVPPMLSPAAPKKSCRTGNICLDIRNGCVLSSEVDPQQLYACSAAGYAGNVDLYGSMGGPFVGSPDLTPPVFQPGMSGLNGQTGLNWSAVGLVGLVGLFAFAHWQSPKGRR